MIDLKINGKTKLFGVIGNPIEHTLSPAIQNTFASIMKKNIIYVPFLVEEKNIKNAVEGAFALNIKGLNITVPHKKTIINYLYDVDEKAKQIGAVNTIKYTNNGYIGYNTDYIGLYYALKNKGILFNNKNVLIIGAGGSACAAAVAALSNNVEKLIIANRTIENALKIKNDIGKFYDTDISVIELNNIDKINIKIDIVINCTVVGFADKAGTSPIKNSNFFKEKNVNVVFDAIYIPWVTKLLEDAAENGCTAINGFDMLIYQAAAAQEIWFNEKYDEKTKETIKNELVGYFEKNIF